MVQALRDQNDEHIWKLMGCGSWVLRIFWQQCVFTSML